MSYGSKSIGTKLETAVWRPGLESYARVRSRCSHDVVERLCSGATKSCVGARSTRRHVQYRQSYVTAAKLPVCGPGKISGCGIAAF